MTCFQSESVLSGADFEDRVTIALHELEWFIADRNHVVPYTGAEVDMLCITPEFQSVYVECKGGKAGKGKRPGAQRTDSVKKAIANGALIKAVQPDARYVVYFSARPRSGSSSDIMLDNALKHGMIDEVHYLS